MATVRRAGSRPSSRRSAHSLSVTPVVLALVEQAAGQHLVGAGKPVEVLVEQREPALVLGHQREAGAVDDVVDAQPHREALGELRLAGTQRPHQRESIARLGDRRQRRGEGARLLGRGRAHAQRDEGQMLETGQCVIAAA